MGNGIVDCSYFCVKRSACSNAIVSDFSISGPSGAVSTGYVVGGDNRICISNGTVCLCRSS